MNAPDDSSSINAQLASRLARVVERWDREARKKLADPFWSAGGHSVGMDVRAAVDLVKPLLEEQPHGEAPEAFATRLLQRLALARQRFDRIYEDPDGFGGGALDEIAGDFRTAAAELGIALSDDAYAAMRVSPHPVDDFLARSSAAGREPVDRYVLDEIESQSLQLGIFALVDRRWNEALDFLQLYLLVLGLRVFVNLDELSDEEFVLYRDRLSRGRGLLFTALVASDLHPLEQVVAFRSVAGASSLLSFVQSRRALARRKEEAGSDGDRSAHERVLWAGILEDLPLQSFIRHRPPQVRDDRMFQMAIAFGRYRELLGSLLDEEARLFLCEMFADPFFIEVGAGRPVTVLCTLVIADELPDAQIDLRTWGQEVELAHGVWCIRLDFPGEVRDISCRVTRIGEVDEICRQAAEFHVLSWRAAWRDETLDPGELDEARGLLSRRLIQDVEGEVDFLETILVVAEGPLALVPYAALLERSGEPLVEAHALVVADSVRRAVRASWLGGIDGSPSALVIGAPELGDAPADHVGEPLPSLPESERECREVAELLGAEPVLGPAATVERFVADAPTVRLLHLATHGELLDGPRFADLETRFQEPSRLLREQLGALRATRIAFSQANASAAGYLHADVISRLDLRSTQLVYLSLCLGSPGPSVLGEAPFGLARAFLGAGAARVLASLLPMSDREGRETAVATYRLLTEGVEVHEALARIQRSHAAEGLEWYAWAGFQLMI